MLRVVRRFESHKDAAAWYLDKGLPVPSNCLVEGNSPLPYDMTIGLIPPNRFGDVSDTDVLLRMWDRGYKERAAKWGVFLACEADFLDVNNPPILTNETMLQIFRRIPPTLTPPPISESEYAKMYKVTTNA